MPINTKDFQDICSSKALMYLLAERILSYLDLPESLSSAEQIVMLFSCDEPCDENAPIIARAILEACNRIDKEPHEGEADHDQ